MNHYNAYQEMADECINADKQLPKNRPIVSIYGSARLLPHSAEYQFAEHLAQRLSNLGYNIIAGGGPGIMEAANKGALAGKSDSIGLNIVLPREQIPNVYQNISLKFNHFASRKAMFVAHTSAFVVMAGGFGTLDELFETLTLTQTHKISPPCPIILVGSDFWRGLIDWLHEQLLGKGLIGEEDCSLFTLTDSEDDIIKLIQQHTSS